MKQMGILNRNLSIYVDLLRVVACFAVVMFHARSILMPRMIHFIANHGGEAVMVFFVLSGFVIRFVVAQKEQSLSAYAAARITRIYPVAILAIVVAFFLDTMGAYVNAPYYLHEMQFGSFQAPAFTTLLRYLTFTHEIWGMHVAFGSLGPYWSLGFEVMYYALFGILIFVSGAKKYLFIGLWFILAGPKIALFLSIWWIGAATFDATLRLRGTINKYLAFATLLACLVAYILATHYLGFLKVVPVYAIGDLRGEAYSYLYALVIAMLASISIVCFNEISYNANIFSANVEKLIRWLAGCTFTLYLLHAPIMLFIRAMFPEVVTSGIYGIAGILAVVICAMVLAEVAERRKRFWGSSVRRLFSAFSPKQAFAE